MREYATDGKGIGELYSVDGRLKASWVASTFHVSLSATRGARRRLIAIGWLQPLEAHQWLLNKYGVHDRINVAWNPKEPANANIVDNPDQVGEGSADQELERDSGSSTPPADSDGGSSTPCLDRSLLKKTCLLSRICGLFSAQGACPLRDRGPFRPHRTS